MFDYQRECPGCGAEFTANRLNQKFCDSRCKARYHNHINRETILRKKSEEAITSNINVVLWNNRELLKANIGKEVGLNEMIKIGFKSNFITRFEQIGQQKSRFFCYDVAYEFVDPQTIKIYTL